MRCQVRRTWLRGGDEQVLQDVPSRKHEQQQANGPGWLLQLRARTGLEVLRPDLHLQQVDKEIMSENDKRCAEALKRVIRWINLSCAQHAYHVRGKVKK